ncbi:MAG: hypothetical protein IPK82_00520 [Polyangiaceae bacterium]|nr:hypothetical protein [Polyangiaceae bacterium]
MRTHASARRGVHTRRQPAAYTRRHGPPPGQLTQGETSDPGVTSCVHIAIAYS